MDGGLSGRLGYRNSRCFPSLLSPEHPPGTPHPLQVAVIAGNFELGELIRNHREQDVGE